MKNKTTGNSHSNQNQTSRQEREIQLLQDLLDRISAHAEALEKVQSGTAREIDSLRKSAEYWEHEASQLRLALDDLYSSRSWKITLPVRMFSRLIRRICGLPFRVFPSQDNKPDTGRKKKARPGCSPRIKPESIELSPRETEIYNELRQVIEKEKNEN